MLLLQTTGNTGMQNEEVAKLQANLMWLGVAASLLSFHTVLDSCCPADRADSRNGRKSAVIYSEIEAVSSPWLICGMHLSNAKV